MSISQKNTEGYILDHENYIYNVYKNVHCNDECPKNYCIHPGLFNIYSPFKSASDRKRKIPSNVGDSHEEVSFVRYSYEKLKKKWSNEISTRHSIKNYTHSGIDAKELSKKIFGITNFSFGNIQGGNSSSTALKCKIQNEFYIIPPMCRFICGEVREQVNKLKDVQFDLVVVDPPWWNKYIRRLKTANPTLSYSMMYNEDIAAIPLRPLLAADSLVAVWCTNAPTNIAAVTDKLFPAWGVTYVATWYWLKVTKLMEPVCNFGRAHMKQPYERIIIGTVGNITGIPDKQLIVSVPSALHSHKPPLVDVLSRYIAKEDNPCRTLELFARYLLPGTTSVGYEPLRWQHVSLFRELCDDT